MKHKFYNGNCLKILPDLNIKADLVICDLPYGVTNCDWDEKIDILKLWSVFQSVTHEKTCFVFFGTEPFISEIRISNIQDYKYDWVWIKDKTTNFLNANKQPLRRTEKIAVFYNKQAVYNAQLYKKRKENIRPANTKRKQSELYGLMDNESSRKIPNDYGYPDEMLYFKNCSSRKGESNHKTEKPVKLLEYLIKTHSNEKAIILDPCMGSGSTAVASVNTDRQFVGIEKNSFIYNNAIIRYYKHLIDNGNLS